MSTRSRAVPWFGTRRTGRPSLDPTWPEDPEIEWVKVTYEADFESMFGGWVVEERRRLAVELLGHVPAWSATIVSVA